MDLSLKLHYGKSYIGIFKDIGITENEKFEGGIYVLCL